MRNGPPSTDSVATRIPFGMGVAPDGIAFSSNRARAASRPNETQSDPSSLPGHGRHALAGPGLKPYQKAGLRPPFFVEGFRWQTREIDCEPTQVFNVLRELSRRHADPLLSLPYAAVSSVLPPALEGASWRRAVKTLGSRLPNNYRVLNRIGSFESRWQDVERILGDEESSLPIIAVSSQYWSEVSDKMDPNESMDHALIVLESDATRVTVFDSYAAILSRSTHAKTRGRKVTLEDGLISVSPVKLLRYWEGAGIPKYLFWVTRTGRKSSQRQLMKPESGE